MTSAAVVIGVLRVGLNSILLINRHIQPDKDICGTGSVRKLKAYINHLLKGFKG